jgi:hypothetical protein
MGVVIMPRIKRVTNVLLVLLALALEVLTLLAGHNLIPAEYIPHVMVIIAFIPKVVAVLAHNSNPDGTPAELPYVPTRVQE